MADFETQPIRVTRCDDGRILVDGYPPRIGVDARLLEQADPSRLRAEGGFVFFRADNGDATYRVVGRMDDAPVLLAERVA